MWQRFEATVAEHITDTRLKDSIVRIPGSCFDILNKHPELKGSVDVI